MTRFARAVGSKASNKREEEEATPWSMMVAGVSQFKILIIVTYCAIFLDNVTFVLGYCEILFLDIVKYSCCR